MSIQNEINDILQNKNISKQEKLGKLTVLLKGSKCDFLVDFDDTISDYRCLLYSKYKYLNRKNKLDTYNNIIDEFKINKNFLTFFKDKTPVNIVIVSSNNLLLLQEIIKKYNILITKIGVNIMGIIGNLDGFKIHINDKVKIIPKEKKYISDIMEYKTFKNFSNYICLDHYTTINYIKIVFVKIFYYLLFVLKNV